MPFCTFHVPVCRKCLKIRLKSNSQGIVYVVLSCQGVRVVGGVRTIIRIYVLSTCPDSGIHKDGSSAIIFQNIPVHQYKPYSGFISFSNKREKKTLFALLHYRPKCENAKVQSASGMGCCIIEDGQDLTVQIPFPFCSLLASSFLRREDSIFPV